MATLKLPLQHNGIAEELPYRIADLHETHKVDVVIWVESALITLAIIAFCWLLGNNMQATHSAVTVSESAFTVKAPADAVLNNFSHGDMPMLPVFNVNNARPLQ